MLKQVCAASLVLSGWLVTSAPGLPSDLEVRAANGVVTIRAHRTKLSAVLDRLSQESGLKVVYDGPRPSQIISTTIEAPTEAEALTRLFEGLGLNYAMQIEPAGGRVIALVLSARASTADVAARPRTDLAVRTMPPATAEAATAAPAPSPLGTPANPAFENPPALPDSTTTTAAEAAAAAAGAVQPPAVAPGGTDASELGPPGGAFESPAAPPDSTPTAAEAAARAARPPASGGGGSNPQPFPP